MRLEVINTGTELLLGHTINTHLSYLGERLLPFGLRIGRQLAIPDGDIIREALIEAFPRNEIVIVTGGLGPTSDDITREITAELLGVGLEPDQKVMDNIVARLARRGKEMNAQSKRQSMVPVGAVVLHNEFGTAPGLYFPASAKNPHLFLLPGPPRELKPMMQNSVEPLLRSICEGKTKISSMRNFRLAGLGESEVADTVEAPLLALGDDIELGYCARQAEVIVRVLGTPEQMEGARNIIASSFPAQFFSASDEPMEQVVVNLLTRFGRTLATAESCTGGLIAHRITNVPGSSAALQRGYVTYSNQSKIELLGVSDELLAAHGAVSREVCKAMAQGCLNAAGTDYAISVTGIAGPGGGTEGKPVGTVYIGVASKDDVPPVVEKHSFPYEREAFKITASQMALDLLRRRMSGIV